MLTCPSAEQWPGIVHMPEYKTYLSNGPYVAPFPPPQIPVIHLDSRYPTPTPLPTWFHSRSNSSLGYDLLCKLFEWDPAKRYTARESLAHAWFQEDGGVSEK